MVAMNTTPHPRSSTPAPVAAVAVALGLAVGGTINVTQDLHSSDLVTTVEYMNISAFVVAMLALIPVVLHLGRLAAAPVPARVATGGLVLLAATCTASIINGTDPAWFVVTAPPANLLILGGLAGLAVALRRTETFPRRLAIALPLSWILALPGAAIGGGIVACAIWLTVAHHLAARGTVRPALAV
jgi:hypothetical protein